MKAADFVDRPLRFARRFFIDPLSVKELSGIARRWQVYVGRCLYIALIGFIVWIFWKTLSERGWMSPSAYAELGRQLFHSFFFIQLFVSTLGGITSASDMITREIRGGTLGLLALTPLTPWRIVAGKWKAALVQTSTVLLCGAPVFAVCVFLGGVGLWELAYSLTLSAVGAALGAAVALCGSAIFRASYVATIVTLISILVYCLVPLFLLIGSNGDQEIMTVLCWTHPLYAAVGATMGAAVPGPFGGWMWGRGWMSASGVTLVLVGFLLRGCTARVRTLIQRPGGGTAETPSARGSDEAGSPRTSFFARLLRGQVGVWQSNAILWKELSTRRVGTGGPARLGLVVLGFLMFTTMGSEAWWRLMLLWFSWLILYLVALANGVSLFVTEREERKWDVLLSTPLGAGEIIRAKLLAGLAGMAPFALLLVVFWSLLAAAFGAPLASVTMAMGSLGLGVLLTYLVGAFASLNAGNQRAAFSAAFGTLVAFLFALPAVVGMLEGFGVFPRGRNVAEFIIGVTNPGTYLAHLSELMERTTRWEGWSSYVREQQEKYWSMFALFLPLYAALLGGLFVWMNHRFDRAAGRS